MRDSLVFYRSFAEAIEQLEEKDQLEALWAVIRYGLNMEEPKCSGASKAVFLMAKPQIDANIKRYQNGSKGGRPRASKTNKNQDETEDEPNEKEKDNVNDNANDNVNFDKPEVVSKFVLSDGTMYELTLDDLKYYQDLYPTVDCLVEFKKMSGWCYAKKDRRKSRDDAPQFVNSWLGRAAAYMPSQKKTERKKKNSFHNFDQRDYDYDDLQKRIVQNNKGDKQNEHFMADGYS